jgi:hypothetical protein
MGRLRERDLPKGIKFLELMRGLEQRSITATWNEIHQLGTKLPKAVEELGTVLSYLDRIASCFWGCSHDDHRLQYLVGRTTTLTHSSLLLASAGHYDEALALIRILGEATNLLGLFVADRMALETWKQENDKQRWEHFRPARVRRRLEELDCPVVMDADRYGTLSSMSVHAGPDFMPNAQNDQGRAVLAPRFEVAGLMMCVNELARCVALISVFATALIDCPENIKKQTRAAGAKLARNVGGVDVMLKGRPWLCLQ